MIPDDDDDKKGSDQSDNIKYNCTFLNSEFGTVWSQYYNGIFNFTLFGETRKPFTNWINTDKNVIHHVGDDGTGRDYPLQFPSWVSFVSDNYIRVMGEFLYLFCTFQDKSPPLERLCLFTLKGHFVRFIIEMKIYSLEDYIVTKDQQIFVLVLSNPPSGGGGISTEDVYIIGRIMQNYRH